MAYSDFFGDINNCLAVAPAGIIRVQVPAGAGTDPYVMFAVGAIQVSITIFDVYVIPTAASGGGTITVETDIGAGYVAMTNAMVCAVIGTVARATTLVHTATAQTVVGPANAMQANKNAVGDAGLVHLLFHLT